MTTGEAKPMNENDPGAKAAQFGPLATAVLGVFATIAGGLTVAGGGPDRVLRNHPLLALGALSALTATLSFAGGATLASSASRDASQRSKSSGRLVNTLLISLFSS